MAKFVAEKNRIDGVYFMYCKIKTPALEYQAKPVADKPWMNKEYVVDVVVDEDTMKALKKKYKTVKAIKNAREFDSEEFEETFKVAPAFEADTYYVIKFAKKAYYKNDEKEAPQPSVVGSVNKIKDRNGNAVNADVEIGNGSFGSILFKERTWDNQFGKGLALDLRAIQVRELVEYVGGDATDDFDFDDDDDSADFEDEAPFDQDEDTSSAPAETQADNGDDEW